MLFRVQVDMWNFPRLLGSDAMFMISGQKADDIAGLLERKGMTSQVVHNNIQE